MQVSVYENIVNGRINTKNDTTRKITYTYSLFKIHLINMNNNV